MDNKKPKLDRDQNLPSTTSNANDYNDLVRSIHIHCQTYDIGFYRGVAKGGLRGHSPLMNCVFLTVGYNT